MLRNKVQSSNLDEVGYHSGVLEVKFVGGQVYQYTNVARDVYDGMIFAKSPGRYFHNYIKNTYPCKKLENS